MALDHAIGEAPARPRAPRLSQERLRQIKNGLTLLPIGLIVLVSVFSPWLTPYNPLRVVGPTSVPPGAAHWFGTDSSGLDVFSQLVAGTRNDVIMALLIVLFASAIGISVGLTLGMNESAGGLRGMVARSIARLFDFIQALPGIVICLVAVAFYGTHPLTLIVAVGVVLCPLQMRLVRTEVMRVRSEAYLDAARIAGLSEFRLTVRHVLPNSCWPALENSTVLFGISIIIMAALGFLGIGLPPPTPEWGAMISRGAADASVGRWWSAGFPVLALILTVSSVVMASTVLFPKRRGS